MKRAISIQARMRWALIALATLVACLNLYFLWGVSKWSEDYVFETILKKETERIGALLDGGDSFDALRPHPLFQIYRSPGEMPRALAMWLGNIGEAGIYEADESEYDFSGFAAILDSRNYGRVYIAGDVSEAEYLESHSRYVLNFALLSLALSIAAAIFLSGYLSRKTIKPLSALAEKVSRCDPVLEPHALCENLADDEIGTLAKEFAKAQRRLLDFAQRESRFTGDVSHELRTPLMAASNAMQLVKFDLEKYERPSEAHLERVSRNLRKMSELLKTFLTLARERSPKLDVSTFPLRAAIEESVSLHSSLYPQKSISAQIDCPAELVPQLPGQLVEVLLSNLIGNAIQYATHESIQIKAERKGGFLTLSIANETANGHGLDFELLRKRHQRGNANQSEGLGIGLSIVERICESTGWHFDIGIDTRQRVVATAKIPC